MEPIPIITIQSQYRKGNNVKYIAYRVNVNGNIFSVVVPNDTSHGKNKQ